MKLKMSFKMKKNSDSVKKRFNLFPLLALSLLSLLFSSGCVMRAEYMRMQRALGAEIIELRQRREQQLKAVEEKQKEIEALKSKIAQVTASIKEIKEKCQKEQGQLKYKIQELSEKLKSKEAEIGQCSQMIKGKGKELISLQQELKKKEEELKKKEEEFQKTKKEFEEKQKQLLAQLKQREEELKKKEKKLQKVLKRAELLSKKLQSMQKIFDELRSKLQSLVDAGSLKIEMRKGMLVLQWPEKILFPTGSARIKPAGKKAIAKVTYILRNMKYRWQVVGHTDSTGSEWGNWKLSARRALAVLRVMLREGMPPTQISFAGFGQFQPIAPNDTKENRALNRRTELVLLPDLSELFAPLKKLSEDNK